MSRSIGCVLVVVVIALTYLHRSNGQFLNFTSLIKHDSNETSPAQFLLSKLPFISNLKELQNFLRVFGNNESVRKKANFRSETDDNYLYYHGAQVWNVKINGSLSEEVDKLVTALGSEVWNFNQDGIDILINQKNAQSAQDYIARTNFTYNIMIDDVESAIDNTYHEVDNNKPNMPWLAREGTLMDWNRYHDMGDITDFLHYCLENYPDIAQIITIGRTYSKRNIEVLRISNGRSKNRAVVISAGVQARDWLSPAAVTYVISKLLWLWDHSEANLRNIDWYFIPVVNPDGFQYSWLTDRLWTKNRRHFGKCYGTNLDRNFEYQWGGAGSSDDPCNNFYRGTKPFSETESKGIRQFLKNIGTKLDAYLTIGAYGQMITYPWGDADFITKNRGDLHKVAKKARLNVRKLNEAEYMIGSSYRLKLAQSGNMADWTQHNLNPKYVYSVFLKDQGRYGYLLPPDYIVESGEEAYEIIRTVASVLVKEDWIYVRQANDIDD